MKEPVFNSRLETVRPRACELVTPRVRLLEASKIIRTKGQEPVSRSGQVADKDDGLRFRVTDPTRADRNLMTKLDTGKSDVSSEGPNLPLFGSFYRKKKEQKSEKNKKKDKVRSLGHAPIFSTILIPMAPIMALKRLHGTQHGKCHPSPEKSTNSNPRWNGPGCWSARSEPTQNIHWNVDFCNPCLLLAVVGCACRRPQDICIIGQIDKVSPALMSAKDTHIEPAHSCPAGLCVPFRQNLGLPKQTG